MNASGGGDGKMLEGRSGADYLDDLNLEFTNLILPAIVYLAILMLLGIVGNGLVLYVYTYKTRSGTITRYIQALAVFDLLSCCLAMPGEIADMSNNYTFGANPMCKVLRTVNLFCTMASGVTLVIVAVDRYKRICLPHKDQLSPREACIIVVVSTCICAVLSSPSAAIFGRRTVLTKWAFINGTDCSISDQLIDTLVPLAYNSFQMILFLVGAVIITVIYFFVARTIFRQARLRRVRERRRSTIIQANNDRTNSNPMSDDPSSHSSADPSTPDVVVIDKTMLSTNPHSEKRHGRRPLTKLSANKMLYIPREQNGHKDIHKNHIKRKSKNNPNTRFVEPSSNTTASPPETPIDQQYFDYKPLVKPQSKPLQQTQNSHSKEIRRAEKCSLEEEDKEQLQSPPKESTTSKKKSDSNTIAKNKETTGERISGNLGQCESIPNSKTLLPPTQNGLSAEEEMLLLPTNEIGNTIIKTQDVNELTSKDAAVNYENQNNDNNKKDNSGARDTDNINGNIMCLVTLQVPTSHADGDSGYGDTGSQEKLRWSTSMVTTTSKVTTASTNRKRILFRSNSDVGIGNGNKHRRPVTTRAATSADEREAKTPNKNAAGKGRPNTRKMRRYSSFKRFRDIKKLSISDPQGTRRTTLMLFLITVIYVISFLPHLLLMIIKVTHPTSLSGGGGSMELAHNIILRSYFINSVANPIIYSFCSRDFFSRCRRSR